VTERDAASWNCDHLLLGCGPLEERTCFISNGRILRGETFDQIVRLGIARRANSLRGVVDVVRLGAVRFAIQDCSFTARQRRRSRRGQSESALAACSSSAFVASSGETGAINASPKMGSNEGKPVARIASIASSAL
jgi:hypothetical protein